MTLKEIVIDYSYTHMPPHIHEYLKSSLFSYKSDLSDLTKDCKPYSVMVDNFRNPYILSKITHIVIVNEIEEQESYLDVNSFLIGGILGFVIGLAFCGVVLYFKTN